MAEPRVNELPTSAEPANNPHAGNSAPAATPHLDASAIAGSSAVAWRLVANPQDVPAIEIAYVRGQRAPTTASGDTDSNTLDVPCRRIFGFGVSMLDPHAAPLERVSFRWPY